MNTWSGLKTRKAGDTQSDARPPDPLSLDATSFDPAASAGFFPSNGHQAGAGVSFPPTTELTPEGQGNPQQLLEASKSMEVTDRFGQLIQDWAKPSQSAPHFHGNPPIPSSPSVARVIGQPPTLLRPPSAGVSAFTPVTAALHGELWQPERMGQGEEAKWPVRAFPGLPMPNAGALNAAHEGQSSPPSTTTTLASAPAEPPPAPLPPAFGSAMSAPQQFDYRLPFSGAAALEQRLRIPSGLEIARVIDARTGSQPHTLEPSYYDFLQLEARPTAAAQGDTESGAHNAPLLGGGHMALEMHHLHPASGPVPSLPFFHRKQSGLHRGGFKVPTLVTPQTEPEFLDHSPNQPETPTNLGNPIAKDPDAWEDKPVKEAKPAGANQEETAGKDSRGGGDKKTGFVQGLKDGFRAFSGGLAFTGADEGAPLGGPGLAAHRTWSAVPVTSPPGSPSRALSDSGFKRVWETSDATKSPGKRPRLTLEQTEPRQTHFDHNEPDRAEASVRNDSPQDNDPFKVASEPLPAPDLPPETADELGRQLAGAQRQLSDTRSQLSDAQRQISDARQQLADAQVSWETDRRQWRQKEAAWEAFRRARMQPGGSPVAGEGSPAVGRGPRYSEDEVGRLISERLIRTESMLIAALAEIGRLRAWVAGMRAAPRAGAAGVPPEGSASGDTGRP